jgi:hypothetical protein
MGLDSCRTHHSTPKRSNNPATPPKETQIPLISADGSKENVRGYICRSFSEPVWVDLCSNSVMQRAVLMAQVEGAVQVDHLLRGFAAAMSVL